MTVLLSPVGGVAAQFLDNNGNPLSGGKLFSYSAGTTTPAATFTSSLGVTPHTNPIVLDSGGRVPGGETWLTDGVIYKFVLQTSTNVLIATYDNIVGINSNFVNFTAEQEIQTATAGQTVFNLTTMQYQPGTNSLTVYVDGVNQYGPGAQYAYLETDSDTVTFVSGLHVGASVKFTTATQTTGNATDASVVSYTPPFTGGVTTNVEAKLAQIISVQDFGAVGDGVTDDTVAFQAALNALTSNSELIIKGDFYVAQNVYLKDVDNVTIDCSGATITWGSQNFILFETCDNVTLKNIQYATCNAPAVASVNRPTGTATPAAFWTFGIVAYSCQNFTFINNHVDFNDTLLCVAGGEGHNVSGNKVFHGKDNTIYFFNASNSTIANNVVGDTNAGRAICTQRGGGFTITGNTVYGGYGFGISLVGTATSAVTGNTVKDIAFDSVVLSTYAGITLEGQEAADVSAGELTAANADLYLFNGAYTRNCVVTGNNIHNCGTGVIVGLGPQGNYGVNKVAENVITLSAASGVTLVNNRGPLSLSSNKIRTCQNAGILFQGQSEQTTIDNNTIEDVNIAAFGFTAIHKDAGVTSMLDLAAGGNLYYGTATRTNFTLAEMQNSDYQQGNWTPSDASGQGLVFTVTNAKYTRIGRSVTVLGDITYPSTANGSTALIGGLPFTTPSNVPAATQSDVGSSITVLAYVASTTAYVLDTATAAAKTNANLSGKQIRFSLTYFI
jgi:parallel beta-helix repeat protein